MSTGLSGKVAFITGVARGQGRAHAVRLAREGASIIGVDICADIESMEYPNASPADLAETRKLVEAEGGKIVTRTADVRDQKACEAALDEGYAQFGRVDIVIANAGVIRYTEDNSIAEWRDIIDVNLTGVWNTCRVAIPKLIEGGRGGSIVMTGSTAGIRASGTPVAGGQAYAAAKHGIVGLMQTLANDLAKHSIRVNTIHPTGVVSGMTQNETMKKLRASGASAFAGMRNALPVEILEPEDVADVVAWLVSDEAKYLTGISLPVDAGFSVRLG